MSTDTSSEQRIQLRAGSETATEELARKLASALDEGCVVGLSGRLGAGKTVFCRGLAEGRGVDPREVSSPSFVYLQSYEGDSGPFHHADLYRLGSMDDAAIEEAIDATGLQHVLGAAGLAAVEWWEFYRGPLPQKLVTVEIAVENPDYRSIELKFAGQGLQRALDAVS